LAAIRNKLSVRNLVLILALLISWSCHRKANVSAPAPIKAPDIVNAEEAPPAITSPAIAIVIPPPTPTPPEKTTPKKSSFDLGEMNFQIGSYGTATKFYQAFLNDYPKSPDRDKALFHMGIACALSSTRDLIQMEAAFKKLTSEFPHSQYRGQAEFILGMQAQIEKLRLDVKDRDEKVKRLSEELQKLKDIDMQRRPTRAN
jgi:TolA-binding protein